MKPVNNSFLRGIILFAVSPRTGTPYIAAIPKISPGSRVVTKYTPPITGIVEVDNYIDRGSGVDTPGWWNARRNVRVNSISLSVDAFICRFGGELERIRS